MLRPESIRTWSFHTARCCVFMLVGSEVGGLTLLGVAQAYQAVRDSTREDVEKEAEKLEEAAPRP